MSEVVDALASVYNYSGITLSVVGRSCEAPQREGRGVLGEVETTELEASWEAGRRETALRVVRYRYGEAERICASEAGGARPVETWRGAPEELRARIVVLASRALGRGGEIGVLLAAVPEILTGGARTRAWLPEGAAEIEVAGGLLGEWEGDLASLRSAARGILAEQ